MSWASSFPLPLCSLRIAHLPHGVKRGCGPGSARPGPQRGSEGQILIAIGLAAGPAVLARPAEELDLVGDDLAAVALDTLAIGPLGVVKAAADGNLHSLRGVLSDDPAEPVEAGHPVPLGILGGEAARILVGL